MKLDKIPIPIERNIFFNKQVTQETVADISKKIIEVNDSDAEIKNLLSIYGIEYTPQPIKVFIDSYGGSVYSIMGTIGVIEASSTIIHTIASGPAMSAGFILLLSGHKRFAHKYARLMYHQMWSFIGGTVKDMEEQLEEDKKLQTFLEEYTAKKTKIKKTKLKEIFDGKKDWYIDSEEALKLGIIDEIL